MPDEEKYGEYIANLPEEEREQVLIELKTLDKKIGELIELSTMLGYNCFVISNKIETPLMGTQGTIDSYTIYQTFKALVEMDEPTFAEFIKDLHESRSKIVLPDETTH